MKLTSAAIRSRAGSVLGSRVGRKPLCKHYLVACRGRCGLADR
jgi:hypothetical protein